VEIDARDKYTRARARALTGRQNYNSNYRNKKSFTVQATGVKVIKLSLFATDTSGK
jgi:hypothetical protein